MTNATNMTPFQTDLLADCTADILEACARIDRYTEKMDAVGFAGSELVQDAVVFNLRVIGKCARTLEAHLPEFMALDTGLPGRFVYPTRDTRNGPGSLSHRVPELWVYVRKAVPVMALKLRAARLSFQSPHAAATAAASALMAQSAVQTVPETVDA